MIDKKTLLVLSLSFILSFIIFGNGIRGDFAFDDLPAISHRQDLKDPRNLFHLFISSYYYQQPDIGLYRPLPIVSYLVNFALFGASPISFHIINIILHALCSFLVFILIRFLTSSFKLALFSSSLFLFHPVHTEAITSIVGRAEVLATLFSLLTIYLFLKKQYLWTYFSFLLALFSKEIALMVLPIIFYIEWVQGQSLRDFLVIRNLKRYFLFIIPLTFYLFLRLLALGKFIFNAEATNFVENPLRFISFPERIFTSFKVLYLYIEKLIFPLHLSNDYGYNVIKIVSNPLTSFSAIAGIVIFISLTTLIIHPKFKNTPLGLGAVIFLLPYLLISNFILTIGTIFAERLIYFSSVGFCLILAFGFLKLTTTKIWKEVIFGILVIILVLYGVRTVIRNEAWLNNDTLYGANRQHQDAFLTRLYYGSRFMEMGKWEEAKVELARAQGIYGDNPRLLISLGTLAEYDKNDPLAEQYYLKTVQNYGRSIEGYLRLGLLYFYQQKYEQSQDYLLKSIELYPAPTPISYYTQVQLAVKTPQKAIDIIHKYYGYNLDDLELATSAGYAYYFKKDYENALKYLTKAKSLGNNNSEVDNMLAISQAMLEEQQIPQ